MEYDVMQVCLNGHKITGRLKTQPFRHEKFCKECGEQTISACPSCNSVIRGDRHVTGNRRVPARSSRLICPNTASNAALLILGKRQLSKILWESFGRAN